MKTPLDHLTTQDLKHLLKEQYRNLTEGMRNLMPDSELKIIERSIAEIEEQLKKRHTATQEGMITNRQSADSE